MSIRPIAQSLLVALAVLATRQFFEARRQRGLALRAQKRDALQAWEGEGGAVPVSTHRTAAVVAPVHADGHGPG